MVSAATQVFGLNARVPFERNFNWIARSEINFVELESEFSKFNLPNNLKLLKVQNSNLAESGWALV